MRLRTLACTAVVGLLVAGCGTSSGTSDEASVEPPESGECRLLTLADIDASTNSSEPVDCGEPHNAETFVVGTFPEELSGGAPDDSRLGAHAYEECNQRFMEFVGGTESLVMRSVLTWAWFRAPDEAWDEGARWFRCDVIGGGEQSAELVDLPETAEGALLGQPDDQWMVCADGPTVSGSAKIPCSEPHTWRAVTTIVLGKAGDPYPGDRLVEVRTRDFCSDSVGAWLNYPVDYDYGYTWFHQPEWKAGNRRSICWAKTDQ